jgi:hypothetical protein
MMLMKTGIDTRIQFSNREEVPTQSTIVGACTPHVDLEVRVERPRVRLRTDPAVFLLKLGQDVESETTTENGTYNAAPKDARWSLDHLMGAKELKLDGNGLLRAQGKWWKEREKATVT